MKRSILAVGAGFLVSSLVVFALTMLTVPLFTEVPLANRTEAARSLGAGWYTFELVYTLPVGMLGGYIASRLARRRAFAHALGLAAVFALMGFASVAWSGGLKPQWHDVAVTMAGIAGCLAGGALRARQVAGIPEA